MKIGKNYLGRYVELVWRDPGSARVKAPVRCGRAALATWKERGVVDNIDEGVIRLAHSEAAEPGALAADEWMYSWIPEELIEAIVIFAPAPMERKEDGS